MTEFYDQNNFPHEPELDLAEIKADWPDIYAIRNKVLMPALKEIAVNKDELENSVLQRSSTRYNNDRSSEEVSFVAEVLYTGQRLFRISRTSSELRMMAEYTPDEQAMIKQGVERAYESDDEYGDEDGEYGEYDSDLLSDLNDPTVAGDMPVETASRWEYLIYGGEKRKIFTGSIYVEGELINSVSLDVDEYVLESEPNDGKANELYETSEDVSGLTLEDLQEVKNIMRELGLYRTKTTKGLGRLAAKFSPKYRS